MIAFTNQTYADSRSQVVFLLENGVVSNREHIKVVGEGSLAGVDLERFDPERLKNHGKKFVPNWELQVMPEYVCFWAGLLLKKVSLS